MGDVEYGKIYDFYMPPAFLRLYDGPAVNVEDMWRILGKGTSNGGLVVGTIIKPKLGLQPKPFGEACYAFWQGGDFIKNDEPQGNQVFCQMNECIPEVVKAMRACIKETGVGKLFSANITADDPNETIARGKYCLSQFGPLSENCAFLIDGYVAGGTAVTCARRNFPKQFLHYHRAGHGSVTSPQTQRGYTAFVHTKISRVIGASGIHTGTMSFGKMEGDASDKNIAFMLQDDAADGPYYHQEWEGMKQTTPIISGGMNALRLPAFFENLGHSNVILTAGGGSFGHKDGPKPGAISCRQGEEAWKAWKAGQYGNISLSDGVIEFAKTHEEIKGAFLTFQKDADQIYPGWKEKLGYTGESSVQAASFDWAKKASAAAFVGCSASERSSKVSRAVTPYQMQDGVYADLEFGNDVGYLPDGTPMNRAGNAVNHPENIGPDPHAPGSPLPRANFVNSVGYLPDGTPLNMAGNAINHPETIQPDPHTPGSPLPTSSYKADVGYLVDGTDLATAGNNSVRGGAAMPAAPPVPSPAVASPPMSAAMPAAAPVASASASTGGAMHGRKFEYSFQKDVYADLEFCNDVGYLPDGTPMNRAGNAINHPENIQPDRHAPGSPLPRAVFTNSVGYLPDGTPLNAAGNAVNHPETMQPDPHTPGSPLPPSVYAADVGYLVDGTDLASAGNNSVRGGAAMPAAPPVPSPAVASPPMSAAMPAAAPVASASASTGGAMHGRKFEYSFQKDVYADLEFCNDVGYLPDGTPMNRAGNAINHPENIQPDRHAPGSPLPRAVFTNSVGYLPDGTPLNAAGNAVNHPETMQPDPHTPGSPLPPSVYAADVGYLVDGTDLASAGNNSVKSPQLAAAAFVSSSTPSPAPTPAPVSTPAPEPMVAAAFVGSSAATPSKVRHAGNFAYSFQKDSFADLEFSNDIGYLPDGTPLNRAGNAINHPENIQPDSHAPGSPLPAAIFVNDVGYLPDGTPLNRAGNAINHPENIGPDTHTPGSPLPASVYAQDVGYLVDGTPMDKAGNLSVQ